MECWVYTFMARFNIFCKLHMSLIITYTLTTVVNLTCMILDSGETCAFYSLQRETAETGKMC